MAAKLWGLPPRSFKVLELQPGENLSGRKSFSLMGEVLRRLLEDVLSERQARFLPSNGKLLRPASARRELSRCVFARASHAESGKTKTARSFILRPKQDKGASAKSVATSRELLDGELVQKSQLHFKLWPILVTTLWQLPPGGRGRGPPQFCLPCLH